MIETVIGVPNVAEVAGDRIGKDQAYLLESTAIEKLGWTPRVGLRGGIERVHAWVSKNIAVLSKMPTDYIHQQ